MLDPERDLSSSSKVKGTSKVSLSASVKILFKTIGWLAISGPKKFLTVPVESSGAVAGFLYSVS
jgi:hypothetical protein